MKGYLPNAAPKAPVFHDGAFHIPPEFGFSQLTATHQNVCVVSILGQSDIFHPGKGTVFRELTEANIFVENKGRSELFSSKTHIEGYYDASHATIFLHLKGLYDAGNLQALCDEMERSKLTVLEMRERFDGEEFRLLEMMVFLFMVSNVVVLCQVGQELNSEWIAVLSAVNQLRRSIQMPCTELIRRLSVHNPSLVNQARVCSPRLLIVLQPPMSAAITMNEGRLRELEAQMEDDLMDVVSLTDLCANHVRREKALFELPDEPFVFIDLDRNSRMLFSLHSADQPLPGNEAPNAEDALGNTAVYHQDHPVWNRVLDTASRSFSHFMLPHIAHYIAVPLLHCWAPDQAAFTLTVKHWFKVCHRLHSIMFAEHSELQQILDEQRRNHNVMRQLAVVTGNRAVALALEMYKDRVPAGKYSATLHLKRYLECQRLLLSHARGPHIYTEALPRLWELCCEYWRCVRHVCASRSLMGHVCRLEVHLVGHEVQQLNTQLQWPLPRLWRLALAEVEMRLRRRQNAAGEEPSSGEKSCEVWRWMQSLRVCSHQVAPATLVAAGSGGREVAQPDSEPATAPSSVQEAPAVTQHVSACSCGWMQKEREDPFDWCEANYHFYALLVMHCCSKFSTIPFHDSAHLTYKTVSELAWYPRDKVGEEEGGKVVTAEAAAKQAPSAAPAQAAETRVQGELDVKPEPQHAGFLAQEDHPAGGGHVQGSGLGGSVRGVLSFPTQDLLLAGPMNMRVYSDSSSETTSHRKDAESHHDSSASQASATNWFSPPIATVTTNTTAGREEYDDEDEEEPVQDDDEQDEVANVSKSMEQLAISTEITPSKGFYGMLTTNTSPMYLPFLSSWCAVNIGPYHTYSHSKGVRQSGFTMGGNFLLPYNLSFPQSDLPAEFPSRKSARSASRKKGGAFQPYGNNAEVLVKVFLGWEYECPQGHRFFITGVNKRMSHCPSAAEVREALKELLHEDLPLYVPCVCANSVPSSPPPPRSHMAQLMRLWLGLPNKDVFARIKLQIALPASSFAATSKGPLKSVEELHRLPHMDDNAGESLFWAGECAGAASDEVVFQPTHPFKTQTGAMFHITLPPAALWLIRLPLLYETLSTDIHRMPSTWKEIQRCRLLKNIVHISVGNY